MKIKNIRGRGEKNQQGTENANSGYAENKYSREMLFN
jgi:hypothetical protein